MSRSTTRLSSGGDRTNFYDDITNKIIAELEKGRFPWVQPWDAPSAKAQLALPKNASTNRAYSGINVLILWGEVIEKAYTGQSWLTFRQALALGGHVRKGERGTTVAGIGPIDWTTIVQAVVVVIPAACDGPLHW